MAVAIFKFREISSGQEDYVIVRVYERRDGSWETAGELRLDIDGWNLLRLVLEAGDVTGAVQFVEGDDGGEK